VDEVVRGQGGWSIFGQLSETKEAFKYSAKYIVLAAGTLASTRLILNAIDLRSPVRMFSSPTAAFMVFAPKKIGLERKPAFGLGQMSYVLNLANGINAFGSTFLTAGIPVTEFLKFLPFRKRFGVDLLRVLLNSCVVGNVFLPGSLSDVTVQLRSDGSLRVEGGHKTLVDQVLIEARRKIQILYWMMGGIVLPRSFSAGRPGADIHYAGTIPMKQNPGLGEASAFGEVVGMEGVYVVDGSCLPELTEKSHTLTIMANADRIGHSIALRMKSEKKDF